MVRSQPPNRQSIRLRYCDYTRHGAYFATVLVTICAAQHLCLFGAILGGEMSLSRIGQIVDARWQDLPNHTPGW